MFFFPCHSCWLFSTSARSPVIVVRMASGAGLTTSSVPVSGMANQGNSSVIVHYASCICRTVGIRCIHGLRYRPQSRVKEPLGSSPPCHQYQPSLPGAQPPPMSGISGQCPSQCLGRIVRPLRVKCTCNSAAFARHL